MTKRFITSFLMTAFVAGAAHSATTGGGRPVSSLQTERVGIITGRVMTAPVAQMQPAVEIAQTETVAISPEKQACLNAADASRGGFVWAAKDSDGSKYAYMREDVKDPGNNACWVRVDLQSTDARINLSGFDSYYFMTGTDVECGAWVDRGDLEKRILNSKKSGRIWGTVAGAVGGAGVGVGAMELFGNRLIGGRVEGQKSMTEEEFLYSEMSPEKRIAYDAAKSSRAQLCKDLVAAGGSSTECQ